MRNYIVVLAAASALMLTTAEATAQSGQGAMSGMGHESMKGSMKGMSHGAMRGMDSHKMMAMNEFMASMKKMDRGMTTAKGRTTDIAFARMMLAHHQGALDMAQTELKYGSDAEVKRMAQQIIDEQTKGKVELEAWLKSHGG